MRNRAKCKLCNSIIESFHGYDYVTCKCGGIAIDGGCDSFKVYANDFNNIIRVDDEGNEIIITIKNGSTDLLPVSTESVKPSREDMLKMLDEMIKSYERLPDHAMLTPITHADFLSALLLLAALFRSDRSALI